MSRLLALTGFVMVWMVACTSPKSPDEVRKQAASAQQVPLSAVSEPAAGHTLPGLARGRAGYPRFPDHHAGVVVFSAEGDLWQVPVRGGLARRLTAHAGSEAFAKFSPDGRWLAFSGDYDGNQDVFVMPAAGGVPRRLTYHPGSDQVLGWTLDGDSVLFRSRRHHPHRNWTVHTVPVAGGDPVRLPLARAARITYEPSGKRVAINRLSRDFRDWKRYAGGTAVQVFLGDLEGGPFRKLTTFKGTNAMPMWHEGRIYFVSDRTGTMNLWSMSPDGAGLSQHTRFEDYDVRFPSLGDGKIVYQYMAGLRVFDLDSGEDRPIPTTIVSDAQRTRTRFTNPVRYLEGFDLSPDGSHLALVVRGDLHLVPTAKEGRKIRVSHSSATRERGIWFSPDGKKIATVSDASGEDEIAVYDAKGVEAPAPVTINTKHFKYPPVWAPRGDRIAYADSRNRLYVVTAKGGTPEEIDRSPHGRIGGYCFSPDGKWLAYHKPDENYRHAIFIQRFADKKPVRVTDEYYEDWNPSWSPDGKYLYFLSDRTINPFLDWLDAESIVHQATKPYLVLLKKEEKSPFLPKDPGEKEKNKDKDKGKGKDEDEGKKVDVEIDTEGIRERVVEVPVKAGNYFGLFAGKGSILYMGQAPQGMADWGRWPERKEPDRWIERFDVKKKKAERFFPGAKRYAISENRKMIAVQTSKGELFAFDLGPKAPPKKDLAEKKINVGTIRQEVEPLAEWRQIFSEVWRMMRDFYFDPGMGKVDWEAMRAKYVVFLDRITTRDELQDLLGEMVAELSLGHTYVWGGDSRRAPHVPVGLLGADLEPHDSGYYRFRRVYGGANWDPARQSPLTLSHVRVSEGDFLIRVDGRPLRVGENVYSRLQRAAGELVQLTVNASPTDKGAREVEVKTLTSERPVRYYTWVKRNREYVVEKTGGRVGYLHIPDMMTDGLVEFDRWYYPQVRKEGLIVDARWNGGGFVSQMLVKRLTRDVLSWARSRDGRVSPYPRNTVNGRIVVLTNESAGSDGDIFPRAIQVAKVGPVIGTRTWGGVVGISGANPLVDKGMSTRPRFFAWWDHERRWGLEGEGVVPDIEIDNDPAAVERGVDAQLDRGIQEVLGLLEASPPRRPDFSDPPDKTKKAWVDRYGQTDKP